MDHVTANFVAMSNKYVPGELINCSNQSSHEPFVFSVTIKSPTRIKTKEEGMDTIRNLVNY